MEAWEVEVRAIPAAQALSRPALRDGLPRLLEVVAALMRQRPQMGGGRGWAPFRTCTRWSGWEKASTSGRW